MTGKEHECIRTLVSSKEVANEFETCFYDYTSGFLHVSFNQLSTTKSLRALITLMRDFNWHIVGISDHYEYGLYDYISGLRTLKDHPNYSGNWSYVLFKCTERDKRLYKVGELNELKPFIRSILLHECNKFNERWEIKGIDYLADTDLQDKLDLCIYLLQYYKISKKFSNKQLSLGLTNGVFKLYESDGLGS